MGKNLSLLVILLFVALYASAQEVLTVKSDDAEVAETQAGNYDRIVDEWKMEAGKVYLICLPAKLDGYYFGPDAKRQKVTSYEKQEGDSYVVSTAEMADFDDFQPGQAYLVTPEIDIDTITHVTGGLKTEAKAGELMHNEANVVDGIKTITQDALDINGVTAIYDLQGRRVKAVRDGHTYIIKGKKVTLK